MITFKNGYWESDAYRVRKIQQTRQVTWKDLVAHWLEFAIRVIGK